MGGAEWSGRDQRHSPEHSQGPGRSSSLPRVTLKVKGRVWCYSPALASVGPAVLTAGPAGARMQGRRERGMGERDGRTDE